MPAFSLAEEKNGRGRHQPFLTEEDAQDAYTLLQQAQVKATHTENKAARRFLSGQYDSVGEDGDELCNLYTALKRAFPGRSRINPSL